MNWKPYAAVAGALAVLLAAHSYLASRDALARMEAANAVREEIKREREAEIAGIRAEMKAQREETQAVLRGLADAMKNIRTPQQAIQAIPQYVPLPAPIQRQVNPQTGSTVGIVPEESLVPLAQFSIRCRACETELTQFKSENARLNEIIAKKDAQIKTTEAERDDAKKTARGGGFWRRTGTKLKWAAMGGAVVAIFAAGR